MERRCGKNIIVLRVTGRTADSAGDEGDDDVISRLRARIRIASAGMGLFILRPIKERFRRRREKEEVVLWLGWRR